MVDLLYRGKHRVINILMTIVAATALWFCFAGYHHHQHHARRPAFTAALHHKADKYHRAHYAQQQTMVDLLYRGKHRVINILMTIVAATALWFCFAGGLQQQNDTCIL
jgi:hypothetical protein